MSLATRELWGEGPVMCVCVCVCVCVCIYIYIYIDTHARSCKMHTSCIIDKHYVHNHEMHTYMYIYIHHACTSFIAYTCIHIYTNIYTHHS